MKKTFTTIIVATLGLLLFLSIVPAAYSTESTEPWPFNVRDFGAKGDGYTDDYAAIQEALDTAEDQCESGVCYDGGDAGGRVYLEPGTFLISQPLIIPHRVQLVGDGGKASIIRPYGTFNSSIHPHLVRLGRGGDEYVLGCRLENLSVDASPLSGLEAVYSNSINENSGVIDCVLQTDNAVVLRIDTASSGTPKNFELERSDLVVSNRTEAAAVADITASSFRRIDALTIIGNGFGESTNTTPVGLYLRGRAAGAVRNIHIEGCDDGILLSEANGTLVENVTGPGSTDSGAVTNLVRIANNAAVQNLTFLNLARYTAPVTLRDDLNDQSYTDLSLSFFTIGNGPVGKRPIYTTSKETGLVHSKLSTLSDSSLTIDDSGEIAVTGSRHRIKAGTYGILKTINFNGGVTVPGMRLILQPYSEYHNITIKAGEGNILADRDVVLDDVHDVVELLFDETLDSWLVLSGVDLTPSE